MNTPVRLRKAWMTITTWILLNTSLWRLAKGPQRVNQLLGVIQVCLSIAIGLIIGGIIILALSAIPGWQGAYPY